MTKQLKGNVPIRTRATAAVRLDQYLAEHPTLSEVDVTAAALNFYFDAQAEQVIEMPAGFEREPFTITPG